MLNLLHVQICKKNIKKLNKKNVTFYSLLNCKRFH